MSAVEAKRGVLVLLCILLFSIVNTNGWLGWFANYDDSDAPPQRSGLKVYRDALTGCEYLGRPFTALQPRMAADGKQVCRKATP